MKIPLWNSLVLAVGAALLAGCAGTGEGGGKDMLKSSNTAMDNMKRVMMMPEAARMAYMMKVQQASLEHGKAMFHDPNLGTDGQTCASCHVGGDTSGGKVEMMPGMKLPIPSLLGVAAKFPKYKVGNDAVITLPEMNNNCIVMFQKGKPLPLDSREARDLAAYVSTLK